MSDRHAIAFEGPLYQQVQKVLRARIAAGEWGPRDPLPGEVTLSHELGVSVGTVRKAMDQLTRESIVTRERGRGTFVRGGVAHGMASMFRLRSQGRNDSALRIDVIECLSAPPTGEELALLKLKRRHAFPSGVLRIRRLWSDDRGLLCRETITLEELRFPRLREAIDDGPETLFAVYADRYRTVVDHVQWSMFVVAAEPMQGEAAGPTEEEGPALVITRTALDARGIPIEHCEQRVRSMQCIVQINR